jgi:hypothetical protein
VVTVFETTRFAKGWVIFAEFKFEIVFPYMRADDTIPKAILDAFRLERVLPVTATRPDMLAAWMFDRVFPYMRAEFSIPKAILDALRLDRVFPVTATRPEILAAWMFERVFP